MKRRDLFRVLAGSIAALLPGCKTSGFTASPTHAAEKSGRIPYEDVGGDNELIEGSRLI